MLDHPEKIGLFGGTFDPPHVGHFLIARAAMEELSLSRVLFIPCRQSPLKVECEPATADDRLGMLSAVLRTEPWAEVSEVELQRKGVSYSIDTVDYFKATQSPAQFFWIMGSDQWELLDQWKHTDRLQQEVEFIVYPRPNPPQSRSGVKMHFVDLRMDLSSSSIRMRVASGLPIRHAVPPEVESWILTKGLYRNPHHK
ncbi:MAG: nicotinate (nicotinamide) nucleotide adenylyltransferase [Candidatus Methylacidiphilales bacterium]